MKRLTGIAVLAAALAVTVGSLLSAVQAQTIRRVSAEFGTRGKGSFLRRGRTGKAAPSFTKKQYSQNLKWLYITMSTTGVGHGGNAIMFSCKVDGKLCNPSGTPSNPAATGWITLQRHDEIDCSPPGAGASPPVSRPAPSQSSAPDAAAT